MNNVKVVLLVIFVLYLLISLKQTFKDIRLKSYANPTTYLIFPSLITVMIFFYCIIYSSETNEHVIKHHSVELNIDSYELFSFLKNQNNLSKSEIIKIFTIYKDSYFDLDRVRKMNSEKDYNKLLSNIEVYDELKLLYLKHNA